MNNDNDPIRNIRDYGLSNGYAFAGVDAGRKLRGLVITLFKLAFAIGNLVAAGIGRLIRARRH